MGDGRKGEWLHEPLCGLGHHDANRRPRLHEEAGERNRFVGGDTSGDTKNNRPGAKRIHWRRSHHSLAEKLTIQDSGQGLCAASILTRR